MTTRRARPSLLALAVSLSVFSGGLTQAAEDVDHAAMGHTSQPQAPTMPHGTMEHSAMQHAPAGMDHSQMSHGQSQPQAPVMHHGNMHHGAMKHDAMQHAPAGMDHSQMDHGQNPPQAPVMQHGNMHHGAMKHDAMQHAPAGMDHGKMGHGAMHGMDHSQMQHGAASRTPIPVLIDADRQAAFPPLPGHAAHDKAINSFFLLDQFEYQDADEGSTLAWAASGWVGGDINRLWLRSEGERSNGVTEDAEVQLLYGRAIGPWWDVVAGVRQDFQPESPQTWAAFGIQGMPLYALETEATAFVGENGQTALRLEGEYDILLTNRLILQPTAEANLYSRNDPARGVGAGLATTEVGVRLRYEIVRQFAPYIGVSWSRAYGNTADLVRDEGGSVDETRLVAGIRLWF